MKNLVTATTIAFVAIVYVFVAARPASADQYGQYGGTPVSQSILIDKMAGFPVNRDNKTICDNGVAFQDNFSASDARFKPSDYVCFRLRVKNTSNVRQLNVTVRDFFPSYIDPVQGPGSFDSNNRTITFNAGDFNVDEEKTYFLLARWVSLNNLPNDRSIICVVNRAEARNDNVSDDDTAQVCVERQVTPGVIKVPATGPEMGLGLIAAEFLALGAGVYLKKKNS